MCEREPSSWSEENQSNHHIKTIFMIDEGEDKELLKTVHTQRERET